MENETPELAESPAAPAPELPAEDVAALKQELDKWKAAARKHEERSKASFADNQKKDELLRDVASKLGIEVADKPDADALSQKLEQAQANARQKTVELAVYSAAASAGANASALLDSREFISRAAQIDTEAVDFAERMTDLVKEAAAVPRFSAQSAQLANSVANHFTQPPASASGAQFGAPSASRQWSQADVDRASPQELSKAIDDGLLMDMGIGRNRRANRQ